MLLTFDSITGSKSTRYLFHPQQFFIAMLLLIGIVHPHNMALPRTLDALCTILTLKTIRCDLNIDAIKKAPYWPGTGIGFF